LTRRPEKGHFSARASAENFSGRDQRKKVPKNSKKDQTIALLQGCSKTTKLQDQDHLFFKIGQAKTKTTFSRQLFLKTIKLLTQDHWRSQKFWLGGLKLEKFLWRYFGDVSRWRNDDATKWRHNYILKFDFIIISFKNHYLAKSRNFKPPILKI